MNVKAYQTRLLEGDEFVYHDRRGSCHSSAWMSSYRGYVELREDQAERIGGRRCARCKWIGYPV